MPKHPLRNAILTSEPPSILPFCPVIDNLLGRYQFGHRWSRPPRSRRVAGPLSHQRAALSKPAVLRKPNPINAEVTIGNQRTPNATETTARACPPRTAQDQGCAQAGSKRAPGIAASPPQQGLIQTSKELSQGHNHCPNGKKKVWLLLRILTRIRQQTADR